MARTLNTEDALRMLKKMGGGSGGGGKDGKDGVSPTISVTAIVGGHTVSITDVNGTQSFNVMDGKDGGGGGNAASSYDEETGELTIYGYSVVYDEETGNLAI